MKFLRFPKRRASLAEKRLVQMARGNDVLSMLNNQNELSDLNAGARTLAAKMVGSVDEFKFGDVGNMGKKSEIDRAEEKREGAIDFLLGDTGLSEGVRAKALKLSNEKGIKFRQDVPYSPGLPDIRVYGTSAEEISRAIAMIYGNIESASGDLVFTPPEKVYLESERDYKIRSDADYANFTSSILGASLASAKDAREWRVLLSVLNTALSKTTVLRDIKQRIDGGVDGEEGEPGAIDEVSDEDRLDNLGAYKDMLKEAAIQNSVLLSGKEKLLSSQDYIDVMEDVLAENPSAILQMSVASKKSRKKITIYGDPEDPEDLDEDISLRDYYRERMVTSSESDGAILESFRGEVGDNEYNLYWKKYPDQFKEIVVNSIRNNPSLLLEPDLWRREDIPKAQTLIDMVDSLDSATLLGVLKSLDAGNMSALKDYENDDSTGYVAFVEKVLYKGGSRPNVVPPDQVSPNDINLDAVIVISRYPDLISIVKEKEVLYGDYKNALAKIGKNERRKLMNDVDELRGDEDIMIAELDRVFKGAEGLTGEALDRYMQKNYQTLANIPPYILFTEEFESNNEKVNVRTMMMKFFESGDAFRNAPAEWKRDDQIVRAVVRKNASAYRYIDSSLKKGDVTGVEILLDALSAEKRGKGNMHWEDVSLDMKRFLASKGVKGIASTRQMVDISLLGEVQRAKPSTGDDVQSPFDNDDMKDRLSTLTGKPYKKIVMAKLLEHKDKPEWLLDTELGTNTTAIKQLMAKESDYFIFIDHDALKDDDSYKDIVRTAVAKDSKYIADVHKEALKPEFILELAGNNQAKLAELIAQLGTDQATDPELLVLLVTSKMFDGKSPELIAFLDKVLVDELDGVTLLELLPAATLKANPKLIIAYFKAHSAKDFKQLDPLVQKDLDLVSRLLDTNISIFEYIPHDDLFVLDKDKYIALLSQAFAANNDNLQFAPDEFRGDPIKLAALAIQNGGFITFEKMMALVPPRLRTPEFVEKVMTVLEDNFKDELEAEYKIGRLRYSSDDLPEALFDFVENKVLTGDNANRSVIKYWPKEMQKDKDRVIGYLRDKKNPKNIALVHKDLRSDQGFIEILLKEPGYGLDIFPYLDHDFLYPNKEFYENLVTRIIKERPELFKYTYESLQGDMDTLWRLSGEDLDTFEGLISRMSPQVLSNEGQIRRILEVIEKVGPEEALKFVERILPDVAYTGTNFINNLLLDGNSTLLLQLITKNPSFALTNRVPATVLSGELLEQLIVLTLSTDTELAKNILKKASAEERYAYIESHPRVLLSLFREDSAGLMKFIGEENLTVQLLRHVISNYDTTEAQWTLFAAAQVKPRVAEGVLQERPDLYINASTFIKDQIAASLGNKAIDHIIAKYENLKEASVEKIRRDALTTLKANHQELKALGALYTKEELGVIAEKIDQNNKTRKNKLTFDSVKMDFDEIADWENLDVQTINRMANEHHIVIWYMKWFDQNPSYRSKKTPVIDPNKVIDTFVNADNSLADTVLNPDLDVNDMGVADTTSQARNAFLVRVYNRVSNLKIDAFKKQEVLKNIQTEILKRFEEMRLEMLASKDPKNQADLAHKVLWHLDNTSALMKSGFDDGLDSQTIRNHKKEANDILERLKSASKPREVGAPLPEDEEAYYNLTQKEGQFVEMIGRTIGTDNFATALGMSKIPKPFLRLQIDNILSKAASSNNEKLLRECFEAIGGTAGESFTDSTLSKLTIAAELLGTNRAKEIIEATTTFYFGGEYEDNGMSAEVYIKIVREVSTTLPLSFTPDDIKNEWAKATVGEDESYKLFDQNGWVDLQAKVVQNFGNQFTIKTGDGTSFSVVRKDPFDGGDTTRYLRFETEQLSEGTWRVQSVTSQAGNLEDPTDLKVAIPELLAYIKANKSILFSPDELQRDLDDDLEPPPPGEKGNSGKKGAPGKPGISKKVTEADRKKMSDLQIDLRAKIGDPDLKVQWGGAFNTSDYKVYGHLENELRSNGSLMVIYVDKDNYSNITEARYHDEIIGTGIDLKIPTEGTVYEKIKKLMEGEEAE